MYKLSPVNFNCLPHRAALNIKITLCQPLVFDSPKRKIEFLTRQSWKEARKQNPDFLPPAPCFTDSLGTFRRHMPQAQAASHFPVWQVPS